MGLLCLPKVRIPPQGYWGTAPTLAIGFSQRDGDTCVMQGARRALPALLQTLGVQDSKVCEGPVLMSVSSGRVTWDIVGMLVSAGWMESRYITEEPRPPLGWGCSSPSLPVHLLQ